MSVVVDYVMISEIFSMVLGIVVIWASAEIIIRASQEIACRFKISETFIGLTILSIGTSLPELGTHIVASVNILKGIDLSGLAIGTNIGSNIAQITVILGIVAISMKVHSTHSFLKKDYVAMMGSILLLFLLSFDGYISGVEGFVLVFLYLAYLWYLAKAENFIGKIEKCETKRKTIIHALMIPVGVVLLLFFSSLVVANAQVVADQLHVSQSLIGALIIGVGTCLPEFVGALVALGRKSTGMSVGILVGSNITNPLFIIGIGALISGYTVGWRILFFDLPVWFLISIIAFIFFWTKMKVDRNEAIALISIYVVYFYIRAVYIG